MPVTVEESTQGQSTAWPHKSEPEGNNKFPAQQPTLNKRPSGIAPKNPDNRRQRPRSSRSTKLGIEWAGGATLRGSLKRITSKAGQHEDAAPTSNRFAPPVTPVSERLNQLTLYSQPRYTKPRNWKNRGQSVSSIPPTNKPAPTSMPYTENS